MTPRAILPNVVMDNLDTNTLLFMMTAIFWFIIGGGFVMFIDWIDWRKKTKVLREELSTLKQRFAVMTTKYANTVVKLYVDTSTSNVGIGTTGSGYKIKLKNKKHTKVCDHFEQGHAKELCQRCWNFRDEHKI